MAKLTEAHMMDLSEPGCELEREADEAFAGLVDYFREYRDCADLYTESTKFEVYDELQSRIDGLKALGVSLRYAERKMQVKWGADPDAKPMPVSADTSSISPDECAGTRSALEPTNRSPSCIAAASSGGTSMLRAPS